MDVDSPHASPSGPPPPLTPANRIAELNQIDQSISTLLSAAADAVGILSNAPTSESQGHALRTPESARSAFTAAAEIYFSTLSSIEVRLRRQVYALEEAELIRPGNEGDAKRGRALGGDTGLTRVGGGPLDPSWLNARATDKVGAGMRRELLAQARDFVERAAQPSQTDDIAAGSEVGDTKEGGEQELG